KLIFSIAIAAVLGVSGAMTFSEQATALPAATSQQSGSSYVVKIQTARNERGDFRRRGRGHYDGPTWDRTNRGSQWDDGYSASDWDDGYGGYRSLPSRSDDLPPAVIRPGQVNQSTSQIYPDVHVEWCEKRYRSYQPSDNTFQPYKGPRRK